MSTDAVLALAATRRARRATLAAVARLAAARAWKRLNPASLTQSWDAGIGRDLFLLVSAAQNQAAEGATAYVDAVLRAQGFESEPEADVVAAALAGIASDGRPLPSLLYQAVIGTKTNVGQGVGTQEALEGGMRQLQLIVETQVIDAGRVADGVAGNANRRGRGYVRVLTPPSCGRCAILAGRIYTMERPFARHPRCLPVGTVVAGPAPLAATRRWFEGELVTICTASGQQLSVTGNHPVLTDRGWVPANLVQEGDDAVRSLLSQGAAPLVIPNERQMPALVEDVWRAFGVRTLRRVPTTAEDFHGDGGHGEVDVVLADGLLGHDRQVTLQQPCVHQDLAAAGLGGDVLAAYGSPHMGLEGGRLGLGAGLGELGPTPLRALILGSLEAGLASAADGYTRLAEVALHHEAGGVVALGYGEQAFPGGIPGDDLIGGQVDQSARWDAPSLPFAGEHRARHAQVGKELVERLAGQIAFDRIVEVRRVHFAGHVHNLSTGEGWYTANTLVVSNCDCVHLPVGDRAAGNAYTTDTRSYFNKLGTDQQDRIFTKAGAQAIRDGADIAQVVNARRGMYSAGGLSMTREGMSRHGLAGRSLRAGAAGRAVAPTQLMRPMPEALYQFASDRAEILSLLRRYGYII